MVMVKGPLFAVTLVLGGCSVFHHDFPTDRCEVSADCFQRVEHEYCNLSTHRCEFLPDARPVPDARPDAMPLPDAPDAGPPGDGGPSDGGPSDSGASDGPTSDGKGQGPDATAPDASQGTG